LRGRRIPVAARGAAGTALILVAIRRVVHAERARHEPTSASGISSGTSEDYAIFTLDPQGTVLDWNAGAERIKGYSASEIVGQNFARFYSAEDRAAHRPEQALAAAAEHGKFEARAWRLRKNGTRFLADIHLDALRDAAGRLLVSSRSPGTSTRACNSSSRSRSTRRWMPSVS
jgi:PAS domain S-box-containing protein